MSARSLNLVQLIGNLTRDPEVRYTGNGTPVATFAVATNKTWKNQEGNLEEATEFHNCVAWNKMAEICGQILKKGMKVYIQGSLTTRSWQDDSGTTKYKTEIRVEEMFTLTPKSGGNGATGGSDDSSDEGVSVDDDKSPVEGKSKDEDPLADLPF